MGPGTLMDHSRSLLALVAVALAWLPSVATGVDVEPAWQAGGPDGGYVIDLTIAPSEPVRVFALTVGSGYYQYAGHIFVSTDSGSSWEVTGSASVSPACQSMAVDPLAANRLYASFWLQGVFRSEDRGQSWTAAREGLPRHTPTSDEYRDVIILAASRELRGTVLSVTDSPSDTHDDVFVTRDSGTSWTPAFTAGHLDFVTWSPGSPEVAYLGGDRQEFARSMDGGSSWQAVAELGEAHPRAIAFHPTDPSRLWVGARGVHRSTDGGLTWELHTEGLEEPVSTEQVATIRSLAVDAAHPEQLVAASWGATYTSSDGGVTWARFPDEVRHLWLTDLEASPEPGGPLLAAAQDLGVYRFENGQWAQSHSALRGASIWLLVADPARPGVAFASAGTHVRPGSLPGLHRTTDGGNSWTTVRSVWGWCTPETFALDPSNGNHVLVSDCEGFGLAASTDGGDSWSLVDLPGEWPDSLGPIVFSPSSPDRVYAFGDSGRVLRSDDRGATWQVVNTEFHSQPWPLAAAVHPLEPQVVYAGLPVPQATFVYGSVARSTDGGETWVDVSEGLPCWPNWGGCGYESIAWLGIHPDRPDRIWAVTVEHGLYVSEDGAASWHASSTPVLAGGVTLIPGRPDTVVVGDRAGGGIVVSDDGGQTWRSLGASLGPPPAVFALASSPDGELLYAGTSTSVLHLHGPTFRRPGGRLGAPAAVTPIPWRSPTTTSQSLTVPRRAPALAR